MTEQEMIDEMVERDLHLFTLIEALEVVENIIYLLVVYHE